MDWDNIDLGVVENSATVDWDNLDLDNEETNKQIMNRGIDEKEYTEEDTMWTMGETKEGKPIYKTQNELGPIDSARAELSKTDFAQGVNKLFGLKGNQPSVKVVDGKREQMDNETINDMDAQGVQELMGQKMTPSKDKDARHFYMYETVEPDGSTSYKYGTAKKSFEDRYKKQPEVLNNAKLLFDQPVDNADELEKSIHGSKWARDNRRFDFGKAGLRGSGGSEYYGAESLFGTNKTGSKQTNVQNVSANATANILDSEQKVLAEKTRNVNVKPEEKPWSRTEFITEDLSKLSTQDFIKKATQANEMSGVHSPMGAYSEDQLEKTSQWQKTAQAIDGEMFDLGDDKAAGLTEVMSKLNWNLPYLGMKAAELKGNPKLAGNIADAIEMYLATDTDINQVGRGVVAGITDPTNWVGGGVAKQAAKKEAVKGFANTLRSYAQKDMVKKTATGAGIGAGYTGAYDTGQQSIRVSGEKQDDINFERLGKSMAIGAGLGGAMGALFTHNPNTGKIDVQPKTIKDEIVRISKEMSGENKSRQELEGLNNQRKALREVQRSIDKAKTEAEKDLAIQKSITEFRDKGYLKVNYEQRIRDDLERQKLKEEFKQEQPKKVIVEGEKPIQQAEHKRNIEQSSMKTVNPKVEKGGTIEGQTYVVPVSRDKKVTYKYDEVGRMYAEESSLLSHMGTSEQKASHEVIPYKPDLKKWKDVTTDLERRMKLYDNDEKLRSSYGQSQSSFNKEKYGNRITDETKLKANIPIFYFFPPTSF